MTRPKIPIATVTELVQQVKKIIHSSLEFVAVRGSITNFSMSMSGHCYFSLSDENSLLSAVIFQRTVLKNPFVKKLKDGDEVELVAELTVYEKRGNVQLIVRQIRLAGSAGLQQKFEEIKSRLSLEGLFDLEQKSKIPDLPKKIALITAPKSAAIEDFLNIFLRRSKSTNITVVPALVQGDKAAKSVINGLKLIEKFNQKKSVEPFDCIVICRGGGSLEDLWAFNNEELARLVYSIKIPVVSAIGHQTDFTILDFVADLRAETPSAAAEILSEKSHRMTQRIEHLEQIFTRAMSFYLENYKLRMQQSNPKHLKNILLKNCLNNRRQLDGFSLFKHPEKYFRVFESQVDLDQKMSSMNRLIKERLTDHKARVSNFENLLEAFSPLKVLDRGYTLVKNKKGGVIMSVKDVDSTPMTLIFNDGETNVQKIN